MTSAGSIPSVLQMLRTPMPLLAKVVSIQYGPATAQFAVFHRGTNRSVSVSYTHLAKRFASESFGEMQVPVLFNCLGREKADVDSIPALLVKQVQSSVYMEDTLRRLCLLYTSSS